MQHIKANLVDIKNRRIEPAIISYDTHIRKIDLIQEEMDVFILPGFVDAHVHIESSMLVPSEFARLAVVHGTVATVSDPHEIANVLGVAGVEYMLEDAGQVNFKFNFGAPSCVPATSFETAGATIDSKAIMELLQHPNIRYLAEMMNWPGVLFQDEEVMAKIKAAQTVGKPVDGHAPGLMGDQALQYISAGISTDHECFTYEEGLHKLTNGMKILIREGSAAKNYEALIDLLKVDASKIMFCSDDKHPDDLIESHIDELVRRSLKRGFDLYDVLRAACINPVEHYQLDVGNLREGDPADFILTNRIDEDFKVKETWINGELVAKDSKTHIASTKSKVVNNFRAKPVKPENLIGSLTKEKVPVIVVEDGQLITGKGAIDRSDLDANQVCVEKDVLKLVVYNRYQQAHPAVAWVQNFNLSDGALASTVAHDSHNIIAVGTNDNAIARAINLLVENKGGIAYSIESRESVLPLPVAGIMTTEEGHQVAKQYQEMTQYLREKLGCRLTSPYMTLSFLALLVIPKLKLSDKGLFDAEAFEFVDI